MCWLGRAQTVKGAPSASAAALRLPQTKHATPGCPLPFKSSIRAAPIVHVHARPCTCADLALTHAQEIQGRVAADMETIRQDPNCPVDESLHVARLKN